MDKNNNSKKMNKKSLVGIDFFKEVRLWAKSKAVWCFDNYGVVFASIAAIYTLCTLLYRHFHKIACSNYFGIPYLYFDIDYISVLMNYVVMVMAIIWCMFIINALFDEGDKKSNAIKNFFISLILSITISFGVTLGIRANHVVLIILFVLGCVLCFAFFRIEKKVKQGEVIKETSAGLYIVGLTYIALGMIIASIGFLSAFAPKIEQQTKYEVIANSNEVIITHYRDYYLICEYKETESTIVIYTETYKLISRENVSINYVTFEEPPVVIKGE